MIKYEVFVEDNGTETWYKNGLLHRENDLPAIIWATGTKFWYKEGKCHRENRPAIIWNDGTKAYYLNDRQVSEEEVVGKKKYSVGDIQNMTVKELLDKLNK
jgi:hypothetical protein